MEKNNTRMMRENIGIQLSELSITDDTTNSQDVTSNWESIANSVVGGGVLMVVGKGTTWRR